MRYGHFVNNSSKFPTNTGYINGMIKKIYFQYTVHTAPLNIPYVIDTNRKWRTTFNPDLLYNINKITGATGPSRIRSSVNVHLRLVRRLLAQTLGQCPCHLQTNGAINYLESRISSIVFLRLTGLAHSPFNTAY